MPKTAMNLTRMTRETRTRNVVPRSRMDNISAGNAHLRFTQRFHFRLMDPSICVPVTFNVPISLGTISRITQIPLFAWNCNLLHFFSSESPFLIPR